MGSQITETALGRVRDLAMDHMSGVGKGHGPDHIERVEKMALKFAAEGSDPMLTSLIALLHDADDYKLFPQAGAGMTNAAGIMRRAGIPQGAADAVISELRLFGYSRRLAGKKPVTPEGMAVSDADMCDIMGATGISRLSAYSGAFGHPFFDPGDRPHMKMDEKTYTSCTHETPVRHMFEKVLRLPGCMLTEQGRIEADRRFRTDVALLKALFIEQDAGDWLLLLDQLLTGLRLAGIKKKPVHVCIGVYPNMQYKTNHVAHADLEGNVEYNRAMRPGRYYFVDGVYVCGGMDDSEHRILEVTDFVARLNARPAMGPSYPYE